VVRLSESAFSGRIGEGRDFVNAGFPSCSMMRRTTIVRLRRLAALE
jgi:hypothetical protein